MEKSKNKELEELRHQLNDNEDKINRLTKDNEKLLKSS
jgi:hypothetical protein